MNEKKIEDTCFHFRFITLSIRDTEVFSSFLLILYLLSLHPFSSSNSSLFLQLLLFLTFVHNVSSLYPTVSPLYPYSITTSHLLYPHCTLTVRGIPISPTPVSPTPVSPTPISPTLILPTPVSPTLKIFARCHLLRGF